MDAPHHLLQVAEQHHDVQHILDLDIEELAFVGRLREG